jgi:ubiquinone/menaquinone biosynthesis C-methylase UbiE
MQLNGKSLLDMGSGTAVLAILARMKNAGPVTAIDNDEWAFNNAIENVQSNNYGDIEVLLGDSSSLAGRKFDVVLANINRNILLADIPEYRKCLTNDGKLIVSGFYLDDLPMIEDLIRVRRHEIDDVSQVLQKTIPNSPLSLRILVKDKTDIPNVKTCDIQVGIVQNNKSFISKGDTPDVRIKFLNSDGYDAQADTQTQTTN